ncbi:MAG: hypothetical protein GXP42_05195 [Chloroflexi bacterium]|nr:hypothetical protein [Chloroflexota bacterium]
MSSNTANVNASQIWKAALAAIIVSIIGNLVVRSVALALFQIPPEFEPFQIPRIAIFTIAGVIGAALVFAWVARGSTEPYARFRKIAIIVLVLSFLPDVGLVLGGIPGATWPGAISLMVMHTVVAVAAVGLLTRMTQ